MVEVIAVIMVFSIPLTAIIGSNYIKSLKIKSENNQGGDLSDLRQQIGHLMSENEELKERLKDVEYILADSSKRINLDYQKEQVLIDKQNKFNQE